LGALLGIAGSLRRNSYNRSLLQAIQDHYPGAIVVESLHAIPLYNADVETEGIPEAVLELKQKLADAPGLLLASPEYNNSVPGVTKNAIDWLSRPSLGIRNVFHGKPVAVLGASPGGFGTILAQSAWLPVFRGLGARYFSEKRLMVSHAGQVFDENGKLLDASVKNRLEEFVLGFREFCGL